MKEHKYPTPLSMSNAESPNALLFRDVSPVLDKSLLNTM